MRSIKIVLISFILFITTTHSVWAVDTCSRTAIVNYQEVLVDTNSNKKGEGLRYYLEKDPVAASYLDKYQEGAKTHWANAALGTLGTLLILSGFLTTRSEAGKRSLLITGTSIITLNFLVAKTLDHKNEANLQRAVDEYNSRNLPKIHFDPLPNTRRGPSGKPSIMLNFTRSF